jgi:hypothetical protein
MHPSQNEDFGRMKKRWTFEALFNGVSVDLGDEPLKSLENYFMLPKRRFWKEEQKMKCGCSIEFSTVRRPNRVLTHLKSASFEIRISSFVYPSKIFVWEE